MDADSTVPPSALLALVPGLALAAAVALAAAAVAPLVAPVFPIPAMVLALVIGIALNAAAAKPIFRVGLVFCTRTVLRWAVALLGLRIAVGDIVDLGVGTALLVVSSMAVTLAAGVLLARFFRLSDAYGALAGAGTAVCGASATLATATVVPDYKGKEADTVFVVVAVNALSTLAMVLYPALCAWLGFDQRLTGVMLGATIHDVAQVVGAGYATSEPTGNAAVIVKLFRVFLLLPVVLAVGWWFARTSVSVGAKVSVPVFALVFLALCLLNSIAPSVPAVSGVYAPIKAVLVEISSWGLQIAIAALGLGTSLAAIAALGWRHIATVTGTTIVILLVVLVELSLWR